TAGATSGNRVAAYLRGEADTTAAPSAKVLDRLTKPQAPAMEPAILTAPQTGPAVNLKKIEELAKPSPEPASAPPAETAGDKADLEKANEKLSGLLGKSK